MKIGILTHYNVYNHGAQLQMYALKRCLEDLGHCVTILTYEKNFDFDQGAQKKNSASLKNIGYYIKNYFIEKGPGLTLFNVSKVWHLKKELSKLPKEPYDSTDCDAIVIGSDEVFSIDVGCNRMMYGYGLGKIPAIAYAPSFGHTTEEILRKYKCFDLVQDGLSNMFSLSARDQHTRDMIMNMTGREVPLVCDPVILYGCRDCVVPVRPIGKRYMLIYSYARNMTDPDEIHEIQAYAKEHDLLTVSVGNYHKWCDRNISCGIKEWYSYFKDANCVVTDTFHGAVVAMQNRCNVAFYIRKSINTFKMESLLHEVGMEDRRMQGITQQELNRILQQPIQYDGVFERLTQMAENGGNYLRKALNRVNEQ